MDRTEEMLKALTEADGVPGYESDVRSLLKSYLEPLGEIEQDRLGSLICRQDGTDDRPRVMLAGHMDEIGFMVRHVTEDGYLKFVQLGGWWDQVLLGHRVVIKTRGGDVRGIIGAKPIHLIPADERTKVVPKHEMVIDVGVSSSEQVAEIGVRVGDPVVPEASFEVLANGKTYLAKAFDDRIGCALMVDVITYFAGHDHPNRLFGVATVQEEVGIRGARTSAHVVDPDVAIVLESDIAGDVPGIKPEQSHIKLGQGPSLLVYDQTMIPNIPLRNLVIDTAVELGIPLQLSAIEGGGTDGGAIHLHAVGVPTVTIGVAARHIHSHGSIIHRDDYDGALQLLVALLARLDRMTVESLTR